MMSSLRPPLRDPSLDLGDDVPALLVVKMVLRVTGCKRHPELLFCTLEDYFWMEHERHTT